MPHHSAGPFDSAEVFPFPYGLDLLPPLGVRLSALACSVGSEGKQRQDSSCASKMSNADVAVDVSERQRSLARSFVQAPLLVLLGDQDTDPSQPRPEIWHDAPGANAQGSHRLARGQSFFQAGRRTAEALGVAFGWDMKVVPGVGHAGGKMAAVAIRMLFDPDTWGEMDLSVLQGLRDSNLA